MTCDPQSLLDAARCFSCIPAGMLASVGTNLLCQLTNIPEEPLETCTDPVETDWYNRIHADPLAVDPTPAQRLAVCQFCHALRTAGIIDKFYFINVMLPGNGGPTGLQRMLYPLINGGPTPGFSPWVNHNFVPADLTNNGLAGDGLTKYLDTGMNDQTSTAGSGDAYNSGLTCVRSQKAPGFLNEFSLGTEFNDFADTGIDFKFALTANASLGIIGLPNDNGPLGFDPDGGTYVYHISLHEEQFVSMSRLAEQDLKLYWAYPAGGQPFAQIDANINIPPTNFLPGLNIYVMAVHYVDSTPVDNPVNYNAARVSFVAFHQGLTGTETNDLFNAVQTLRAALGGGTV